MKILRTPDSRFANLTDYPFAPHYTTITTEDGSDLEFKNTPEWSYNLSGTYPDAEGQVTCPECGLVLRPTTRNALTRQDMHMSILKSIVVPFVIWGLLTVIGMVPLKDSIAGIFVLLLFFFGYPLALLIVSISLWSRLHMRMRVFPRPYHRGLIPLWIALYAIASVATFIGVMFMVDSLL